MKTLPVKLGAGVITLALITLLFVQYKTEHTIKKQLRQSVAQQLDYNKMQARFFGTKIVFENAIIKNIDANEGEFNFKADKLTLDVDYTNALLRNFQVKGIEAQGVSLSFDYTAVGDSNIHDIQKNLRNYINFRKVENKPSINWDVYTIELRDVNVELKDFQYGEIGTFTIESITIPHVSSKYSGKNNRDILFLAVAKELSKQFLSEQIQGDYDTRKLPLFIAREAKSELDTLLQSSKNIMNEKFRSLWQNMNATP